MKDKSKEQDLLDLLQMAKALLRSMDTVISRATNKQEQTWHFTSYGVYAQHCKMLMEKAGQLGVLDMGVIGVFDLEKMRGIGDTVHIQQDQYFHGIHGSLSMLCAVMESRLGLTKLSDDLRDLQGFLATKLRPAMLGGNPENEKQVQDTLEQILIGKGMQRGVDYDRETGRVKHSGKESVPDFIFPPLTAALEVKLIKDARNIPRTIDEMNADLLAYGKKYPNIVFLVYDNGCIGDVSEFKKDFETGGKAVVLVVKN